MTLSTAALELRAGITLAEVMEANTRVGNPPDPECATVVLDCQRDHDDHPDSVWTVLVAVANLTWRQRLELEAITADRCPYTGRDATACVSDDHAGCGLEGR